MATKSRWFGDDQPRPPGWREYYRNTTGRPGAFCAFSWCSWIVDQISLPAPPWADVEVMPETTWPSDDGRRYRLSFDQAEIERLAAWYDRLRREVPLGPEDVALGQRLQGAASQLRAR